MPDHALGFQIVPPSRQFKFGPFQVDSRTGELRKHGIKIRIGQQTFELLLMLLEHPGEAVLREEIRLKLWPNDTVVEFDHSINAAIQKLRAALGESADKPRYIDTVARRGYRFLGEVEAVGAPAPAPPPEADRMNSDELPGQVLGHYRIAGKLGEGGMGSVFRAQDLKLGREVAIKFPAEETFRRFEREARAAAALNHPNICTIHGLENLGGRTAIVMELLGGETLESRLARGPLPRAEALAVARQVADALGAAHRKGVVHRDLKPGNVMLTATGPKVLDFGLAKIEHPTAEEERTHTMTEEGTVLGTVQYMSPEQAQGKEADARSDIFSFGVVLYEMLTGKRAFEGSNRASILAAILERETPALEPEGLNRVVKTCLAKAPDDRFQTARDLQRALEWSSSDDSTPVPAPRTSRRWVPWTAAAALVALAFLAGLRLGPPIMRPRRLTLTVVPPSGTALDPVGTQVSAPEISPDGSSLLFAARGQLWVRRLDSLEPKMLRGAGYYGAPFWSADSRAVVFPASRDLVRILVPDGAPETIAQDVNPSRGGSWSDRGTILVSHNGDLYTVPASGGELKLVRVPGTNGAGLRYPQFLPGGDDFLVLATRSGEEGGEVYLATLRDGRAVNSTLLMKNDTAARYTPADGGRLLFVRGDNLYSQELDRKGRKLTGDSELVQSGVASSPVPFAPGASFSVSRSGVLAWRTGRAALNQVTAFDRKGKVTGTAGPRSAVARIALSPDETRLLVAFGTGSWLLEPGQPGHLDLGPGWEWNLWSPDGSHLLGISLGPLTVGERSVSDAGEIRELGTAGGNLQDVSPDGKYVLVMRAARGIYTMGLQGPEQDRTPRPLNKDGAFSSHAGFSPDGRWIVYQVRGGVYVQPFPGPGLRTQIPGIDGIPVWRKDGKEIVVAAGSDVWSVPVDTTGERLHFGAPQMLFSGLHEPAGAYAATRPLAVSRDGSRIYWVQGTEQPDSNMIHIRTGW